MWYQTEFLFFAFLQSSEIPSTESLSPEQERGTAWLKSSVVLPGTSVHPWSIWPHPLWHYMQSLPLHSALYPPTQPTAEQQHPECIFPPQIGFLPSQKSGTVPYLDISDGRCVRIKPSWNYQNVKKCQHKARDGNGHRAVVTCPPSAVAQLLQSLISLSAGWGLKSLEWLCRVVKLVKQHCILRKK